MNTNLTVIIYLLALVSGYFIGSVSFARIIFKKLTPGKEPTRIITPTTDENEKFVSHAIGATNVMIAFGPRWGMLTTFLDVMKAFIPVLILKLAFPDESFHLVCAVAVLIGHLWPVWYRFSGGGGNSSIMGMILAISPIGLLITHAVGMIVGKFAPAMSFLGGVMFTIPWFIWRNGFFSFETLFAFTITIIYVTGQIPEIIQLNQLKKRGISIDMNYVKNLMKHSGKKVMHSDKIESDIKESL